MDIKQLQPKQGNVDIELDVLEIGDAREFQKFGKAGRVATAQAKDATGAKLKLTLWNDDIDRIKAGDKVKLTNGYVSEWQGELQLTTGRFGKIEVLGKTGDAGDSTAPTAPVYKNYDSDKDDKLLDENVDEENIEEI